MAKETGKSIQKQINDYYNSKIHMFSSENVKHKIEPIIESLIKESYTYNSLISGSLRGAFGFPVGEEKRIVDPVIEHVVNGMIINVKPRAIGSKFDVSVRMEFDFDKSGVFSLEESIIESDGGVVNWVDWLLTKGSSVVVEAYHVVFGNFAESDESRSKIALMFKGGSFSVPSKHAGTDGDNFISRAISNGGGGLHNKIDDSIRDATLLELDRIFNG